MAAFFNLATHYNVLNDSHRQQRKIALLKATNLYALETMAFIICASDYVNTPSDIKAKGLYHVFVGLNAYTFRLNTNKQLKDEFKLAVNTQVVNHLAVMIALDKLANKGICIIDTIQTQMGNSTNIDPKKFNQQKGELIEELKPYWQNMVKLGIEDAGFFNMSSQLVNNVNEPINNRSRRYAIQQQN